MNALIKALELKNSITDISNYKKRFKEESLVYDDINFTKLYLYIPILKNNSTLHSMNKRYYQRPDYVAYDYLGTTNLSFVILLINDCFSALDFTRDFLVPNSYIVSKVLTLSITKSLEVLK